MTDLAVPSCEAGSILQGRHRGSRSVEKLLSPGLCEEGRGQSNNSAPEGAAREACAYFPCAPRK